VTQEEVNNMIKALPMFQKPTKLKKRKVILDSDSKSEAVNNRTSKLSDNEYTTEYCYNIETSAKRKKTSHLTTEVIVKISDRHGEKKPIRCLLDTGTSATIVLREYVAKGKAKGYKQPEVTRWSTMGGVFTTKRKALLEFKLPEFSTNKTVEWVCHINENTTPKKVPYTGGTGTTSK
jgi:hypothetical protein